MTAPDQLDLRAALTEALDRIDALETEVRELRRPAATSSTVVRNPSDAATPHVAAVDRRHLLGKAGVAAVGAVLGGTVAAVTAASPAAAASGSFDSNSFTPALTAANTGSGPAVRLSTNGGKALEATSPGPQPVATFTSATGIVAVHVDGGENSVGTFTEAENFGLIGSGTGTLGVGVEGRAEGTLFGVAGRGLNRATGVAGYSEEGVGMWAWGKSASILLGPGRGLGDDLGAETPPPRTSAVAHERGELAYDTNNDLWLCVADGTPGTWVRLGGPGTTGAFTVLHSPVRVYDTRPNSGKPGANTGPVAGIRHDIDLTANKSGLPLDATAAVVNLAVTDTTPKPTAYAQIYANDLTTPPLPKTITWTGTNQAITSTTTTAITAGKVTIRTSPSANILIDVIGYHR